MTDGRTDKGSYRGAMHAPKKFSNGVWTWKNYISFLWYAEIIVIGYNLVFFTILWRIFLSEQNAMFYLIMNIFINMIFLID